MEWPGDWDLLFKLKRQHQMAPLTAQEAQDAECTTFASAWLRVDAMRRQDKRAGIGALRARGVVVSPYGANSKGMKHYTDCTSGEIVWR